jgi:hypothetical protein
MENKYFEIIETDSPKAKQTLAMLAKSTLEHCQKVHKLWQEHK